MVPRTLFLALFLL